MSVVIEAVFSRITKDILLLDDMAAEETLQVHLMKLLACSWLETLVLANMFKNFPASKANSLASGEPFFFIGVLECYY